MNGGSQQFFYCFGCQASGDVFSFVGKIENVTFPEAVRIVAQKCGIPLPKREFSSPEEAAGARLRTKLLELNETAAAWFEEQMRGPEGALAREYLAGRGLSEEGIKKFRIGYAPDSFNALRDRLGGMADPETLRLSGLFSSKEQEDGGHGRLYDRFRKRVVFPICNEGGRVIAFTARTLGVAAEGEKAGPKYVNSPETPLYSKGQVLFNLDKAKTAIRTVGFALLVEGQMDCISVFLRGIQNVIATSGTAFTEQQVAILKRHTSNVIVNFDPDAAGANAAEKSISLLTEEGFAIKLVTLEGGLDPDRFIRERGVEAYKEAIRAARRQSDYLIARAMVQFPGASAEQKVKALNFLLPHIRRIPEKLARDQFAADAAQKLGIDSAVLREELHQAALKRRERVETRPAALTEVERVLLRALAITDPEGETVAEVGGAVGSGAAGVVRAPRSVSGHASAGNPRSQGSDGRSGRRGAASPAGRGAAGRKPATRRRRGRERAAGGSGARHRKPPAQPASADCRGRAARRLRGAGGAHPAEAGSGPGAEAVAQPQAAEVIGLGLACQQADWRLGFCVEKALSRV